MFVQRVGETGARCYNFLLKPLLVKSMLHALFLSLNLLFVLIKCTIPMIFHIRVRNCYIKIVIAKNVLIARQVSLVHVTGIT